MRQWAGERGLGGLVIAKVPLLRSCFYDLMQGNAALMISSYLLDAGIVSEAEEALKLFGAFSTNHNIGLMAPR